MEFNKQALHLPKPIVNLFDTPNYNDVTANKSVINQPQMDLSFNYFTHIIKNRLDDEEYKTKLNSNRKYKYIVNPFEHSIELKFNDFQDITHAMIKTLDIKEKISSRSFFKMWEMLVDYDLIDADNKNFNSFHMAEAPGGFVQATILYNDKINKTPMNSKFFGISLENEIKFNSGLQKQYGSGKNRRFYQFKNDSKMTGDITKMSVIDTLVKTFSKEEPDLITADGGFDPVNENFHEQESYMLFLGEIFTAVSLQKKGGHFVCKFLDMYTNFTAKLVYIVSMFYEDVHLLKPFTSRQSNSERYLIAKDFKYKKSDKEFTKYYSKLKEVFVLCKKEFDDGNNLINIFPNFEIPNIYKSKIANFNQIIGINQYKNIDTRLQYFKSDNLTGDLFKKYSKIQEESTKYWISEYI